MLPGLLALSMNGTFAPALGGVVVPDLGRGVALVPLSTDASGAASFVLSALPSFARGSTVYGQAFVADPGAPAGIAFSNGVLAVVP